MSLNLGSAHWEDSSLRNSNEETERPSILAIYRPMIYTILYVMLLMRAIGKGVGPENLDFFGPVKLSN
jgi:hypothetical protein